MERGFPRISPHNEKNLQIAGYLFSDSALFFVIIKIVEGKARAYFAVQIPRQRHQNRMNGPLCGRRTMADGPQPRGDRMMSSFVTFDNVYKRYHMGEVTITA